MNIKYLLLVLVTALVTGCASFRTVEVHQPMTARPVATPPPVVANNGSIYQPTSYVPLFEDRRARKVGDTITISLNEKLNASKTSASSAERKQSLTGALPTVQGLPGKTFQGASVSGSSSNSFEGKGDSANTNLFTGTITVTVIEVLANGNLLVSGEKQMGINQGSEFIRFSGVVNPNNIVNGNTVTSTQVADARIEYRGTGYIDEAQTMGWLARFFLSFLPI